MNRLSHMRRAAGRRQGGTAAVEMAILSFVMLAILASPILIARSVMQATLAQRAVFSAAHMLATYPNYARRDPALSPLADATAMAAAALTDAGLGPVSSGDVGTSCTSSANCAAAPAPTDVSVNLPVNVLNPASIVPVMSTVQLTINPHDRYVNACPTP